MLKILRSLLPAGSPAAATPSLSEPPVRIDAPGAAPFPLAQHLTSADGLPVLDWAAVTQWVNTIADEPTQAQAWSACELGWLEHLRVALGPSFRLRQQGDAVLVSSLPDNVARATLDFMTRTQQRVLRVLDGIAHVPEWGRDILVVFDDPDSYYRYVAHHYPDAGEYALSSGMYLNHGCGHFLTVRSDLRMIEPVIAHELTHACLGHLPIPAWLNEGLAVNTEHRLSPPPRPDATPQQMHARHRRFWGPQEMQEFWSGQSFLRPDEGNELSYDLARILVSQLAADWPRFVPFAQAATLDDAGATAAREHLGVPLGELACALLEGEPGPHWEPQPALWTQAPERGAF
jgi:hypothetical protein